MPIGTPPNGSDTSADAARSPARSGSREEKALRSLPSTAARTASSSSVGERSPARKASTSEQASPCQGGSGTPQSTTPEPEPRGGGPCELLLQVVDLALDGVGDLVHIVLHRG